MWCPSPSKKAQVIAEPIMLVCSCDITLSFPFQFGLSTICKKVVVVFTKKMSIMQLALTQTTQSSALGLLSSFHNMSNPVLSGWPVDEDAVETFCVHKSFI